MKHHCDLRYTDSQYACNIYHAGFFVNITEYLKVILLVTWRHAFLGAKVLCQHIYSVIPNVREDSKLPHGVFVIIKLTSLVALTC